MILWGLLLIVIGVGALLGVSVWPLLLIVAGGALLLSAKSGRPDRYLDWWCC